MKEKVTITEAQLKAPYKTCFPKTLKEGINENAFELAEALQTEILKIFPKSYVDASVSGSLGYSIFITFALGKDASEFPNRIIHNDPAHTLIMINGKDFDDIKKDGSITGVLEAKSSISGITIKSTNKYYAYESIKFPFRKTTGDSTKILTAVKKYFLSLKKTLQDNRDKMTDEHLSIIGDKF